MSIVRVKLVLFACSVPSSPGSGVGLHANRVGTALPDTRSTSLVGIVWLAIVGDVGRALRRRRVLLAGMLLRPSHLHRLSIILVLVFFLVVSGFRSPCLTLVGRTAIRWASIAMPLLAIGRVGGSGWSYPGQRRPAQDTVKVILAAPRAGWSGPLVGLRGRPGADHQPTGAASAPAGGGPRDRGCGSRSHPRRARPRPEVEREVAHQRGCSGSGAIVLVNEPAGVWCTTS